MTLTVRLCPPLSDTSGHESVSVVLEARSDIRTVLEDLAAHFGSEFRRQLFDVQDRVIPAWCAFVNGRPVQLNRDASLATELHDGDELVLLLNIAGGSKGER